MKSRGSVRVDILSGDGWRAASIGKQSQVVNKKTLSALTEDPAEQISVCKASLSCQVTANNSQSEALVLQHENQVTLTYLYDYMLCVDVKVVIWFVLSFVKQN